MTINVSSLTGGGSLLKMAADLDWPSQNGQRSVNIDPSGALTDAINETGKYSYEYTRITGLPTTENVTVQLDIDGVTIWNDTFTPTTSTLGLFNSSPVGVMGYLVESSIQLQIQTVTDTSVSVAYILRPIV